MTKAGDVLKVLCEFAPLDMKTEWDNCGLLVGGKDTGVNKALICLDVTKEAVRQAKIKGADLIVSHHPAFFADEDGAAPEYISESGIAVISMHTNLDICPGGVNDKLGEIFGIVNIKSFEIEQEGALGRIGELSERMETDAFLHYISDRLNIRNIRSNGVKKSVKKVAYVCGSGADGICAAQKLGADAFVTGDMKYHAMLDAKEQNFLVADAGHYATEIHAVDIMKTLIEDKLNIMCEKYISGDCIETFTRKFEGI